MEKEKTSTKNYCNDDFQYNKCIKQSKQKKNNI